MHESHEARAREIRADLDGLASFLSPELIAALSEAAQTEEAWSQAAADVNGFLAERNIEAPRRQYEDQLLPGVSWCASQSTPCLPWRGSSLSLGSRFFVGVRGGCS